MDYEIYSNMPTIQKDLICDGIEIQQKIQQYHDNEKNKNVSSSSLKCHPTNHSQINIDQ